MIFLRIYAEMSKNEHQGNNRFVKQSLCYYNRTFNVNPPTAAWYFYGV